MKLSRKSLLIAVAAGAILVGLVVSVLIFGNKKSGPEIINATPSATATPFATERTLLGQLSKDLSAAYLTYDRPGSPAYYESIKPFLTTAFFDQVVGETSRVAARITDVTPVTSQAKDARVTAISDHDATVEVAVRSKEKTGKEYDQTAKVHWVRVGDRWSADSFLVTKSDLPAG